MNLLTSPNAKSAVDAAVAEAKNLPDLVNGLSAIDPSLATQITGKALLASKSPWGTLLAGGIAWAAGRYGFGWTPEFDALLAGLGVLGGAYAMRAVTGAPITGLISPTAIDSAPFAAPAAPVPTPAPSPAPTPSPAAPMAVVAALLGGCGLLAGCASGPLSTTSLAADAATPAGQLFCAIEAASGPLVVAAIDAEASSVLPGAAPVAVIATGAAKSYVDAACASAGGIPVSPPSNPAAAPKVAVVVPVS